MSSNTYIDILNCRILIQWSKMRVGDSVFVPTLSWRRYVGAIKRQAEEHGYLVECRKAEKDGMIGLRVWRIW